MQLMQTSLMYSLSIHYYTQTCTYSFVLHLCVQGMFEPFLKSFYVRSSDPLHIKLLKVTFALKPKLLYPGHKNVPDHHVDI